MINKSGCILINKQNNKVALVYRKKYDDYSFPKGHIDNNESLIECAIRETEEEIKRIPIIENNKDFYISNYNSEEGSINVYYYVAYDGGKSNNISNDTHPVKWIDINEVINILTYESDKKMWKEFLRKENYK